MKPAKHKQRDLESVNSSTRSLAESAFSRAAGAQLIEGNEVRLLKDAKDNYPAWLESMRAARRHINFESYIIHEDEVGREFSELLQEKARDGVRVRLIYDWMGGFGKTSRSFWRKLSRAGVEVRCFNPPSLESPFGWLSRDHRKMISVDGEVGYVTGLCVGRMWAVGEKGGDPWRDTGVAVRGPAVADIERAFAQVWAAIGSPIPEDELPREEVMARVGDYALRVVDTVPSTADLYRLDQLIAAIARRRLWLTDAYFAGTTAYVQALNAASHDGVDVRLLVPGGTDIPLLRPISRAGYRPLLESGVRVFEWNGSMLHAKTAVADGRWARVGSTNLNVASWLGNYELDVAVEDPRFAKEMEEMYLEDLKNATEIVLNEKRRVEPRDAAREKRPRGTGSGGSAGRAAAGALRISNTVGAAITNQRVLGQSEGRTMVTFALSLITLSVLIVKWPLIIAVPLAVIGIWFGVSLLIRAYKARSRDESEKLEARTNR